MKNNALLLLGATLFLSTFCIQAMDRVSHRPPEASRVPQLQLLALKVLMPHLLENWFTAEKNEELTQESWIIGQGHIPPAGTTRLKLF
jgi:hypothetical protein